MVTVPWERCVGGFDLGEGVDTCSKWGSGAGVLGLLKREQGYCLLYLPGPPRARQAPTISSRASLRSPLRLLCR